MPLNVEGQLSCTRKAGSFRSATSASPAMRAFQRHVPSLDGVFYRTGG